jgi:ABC-type transport system involved in cytochrome c biogenesis permease subunit
MPNLDLLANLLLIAALVGYFAAGALLLTGKQTAGLWTFGIGWGFNALVVLFNWLVSSHPPFGSMYHVLVAVSLCFLPAFLYLRVSQGLSWLGASFAFTSWVPLLGPLFMERDMFWRRMPALQSPWFVPHVMAYLVAYALAAVGFILALRVLSTPRTAPANANRLVQGVDAVTRLAFPFMTFGLLSGALWADSAWGRYWSWDSKETWALIMWLCYALYFHCRRLPWLQRFAMPCQIAGFAALIVTFLFVSLIPRLGSVLHTYSQ